MKKFKYNNKATVLRGIKESTRKKRRNWDRIIYLAVFMVIVITLLGNSIMARLIVTAPGEVITKRFSVQFPEDIRVLKYFVEEGDTVEIGDTLFLMEMDINDQEDVSISLANAGQSSEWLVRERLSVDERIHLKELEQVDAETRISELEKIISRIKVQVFLDVYSPEVLNTSVKELRSLELALNKVKSEIDYLKQHLRKLDKYEDKYIKSLRSISSKQTNRLYMSPVRGQVTKIFHPEYEVVYEKTVAVYISDIESLFIKAYLEQSSWDDFDVGDLVDIDFMDGTKSVGRIEEFYLNTETLPEEFRKVQTKEERSIIADILPVDGDESRTWTAHYGFSANISKFKNKWLERWKRKIEDK